MRKFYHHLALCAVHKGTCLDNFSRRPLIPHPAPATTAISPASAASTAITATSTATSPSKCTHVGEVGHFCEELGTTQNLAAPRLDFLDLYFTTRQCSAYSVSSIGCLLQLLCEPV